VTRLNGTCAARGSASGTIRILPILSRAVPDHTVPEDEVAEELELLEKARRQSVRQIEQLLDETDLPPEHREIFESQILLLDDPMLFGSVREAIQTRHQNAAGAIAQVVEDLKKQFEKAPDPMFRERIADLEDIAHRVLSSVLGTAQGDPRLPFLRSLAPDAILAAEEIPPSLMLHIRKIAGLIVEQAGVTGHMAILARDRGIPAVVNIEHLLEKISDGQQAILLADNGTVILNPTEQEYAALAGQAAAPRRLSVSSPVRLRDGEEARLWLNLDDPEDAMLGETSGVHGIGLFRTEFIFYKYPDLFDSPEDHAEVYRKVFEAWKGKPVTCRLLDVGDDKTLPQSLNRYLAPDKQDAILRGVRFLLGHPGLLRLQLRALLEAALDVGAPAESVRILVPLVSTRGEILEFRQFFEAIRQEVEASRRQKCPDYPVGVMMETPAACVMSDVLSRYADFFSLGTNDLAGLALAFHRAGPSEDPFYQPALFRLIQMGLSGAKVPVSICGEMAGIPQIVPVLATMGIRDFSASLSSLPEVEHALKEYDPEALKSKLSRILTAQNREEVKLILTA
jgi:phosphotransferase system enzyme I (PtsI)